MAESALERFIRDFRRGYDQGICQSVDTRGWRGDFLDFITTLHVHDYYNTGRIAKKRSRGGGTPYIVKCRKPGCAKQKIDDNIDLEQGLFL